jgi:hypothetical protein
MSEHVELIEHDDGIHEIIFHEATRQAVDDYMILVERIIEKQIAGREPVACVLLNLSHSGVPPFAYITQKGRSLLHEHHKERDAIHLKSAFLAKDSAKAVLSLAETFIKMLPIDATFKVFDWTKRSDAEAWLLSND